ncbi:hypothetical protein [Cellulophaga baltica]|uniref:hypothetical protein n=1 Tax=Cellulophaga baltica TaxID=76594 RepID=UPI00040905B6|nr:hypothetical protein [Cellulophaga baltica]
MTTEPKHFKEIGKETTDILFKNSVANKIKEDRKATENINKETRVKERNQNLTTWINIIIGVLNVGLLAWQILKSE